MSVLPPKTDVEDLDNEKREMNEADIAGLHRFYSKHLELPDHNDLFTLFSQVPDTHTHTQTELVMTIATSFTFSLLSLFIRLPVMVSL